jgi:hypothetical protein
MSAARGQFLGRIEAIRTILTNPISTDVTPVPIPASAAVVTRNGCMVMLFCALEAFLRDRSLECARNIDQAVVPYAHLPDGLKHASLIATFDGLFTQTRGWPMADRIREFESACVLSASGALGSPYQFTSYSFARDKSNISAEDVGQIAKSFGVANFWASTRNVNASAGAAIPGNVDDLFRQLARERNKAAHVASHNVPHSSLTSAIPQAVSIALGFDALISTATYRLSTSAIAHGTPPTPTLDTDIQFITIRPHVGRWAAFRPAAGRALFVEGQQDVALARATAYGRPRGLSVVCHDAGGRASNWTTILG